MSIRQDSIKYDSKTNFIIMKTQGVASADRMKLAFNKILELCEINKCNSVLIDAINITKLPAAWNLHEVGTYFSQQALKLSKIRIAFAIPDTITSDFRFFDNVLANRMVDISIFKNVADAKEWLLNKE